MSGCSAEFREQSAYSANSSSQNDSSDLPFEDHSGSFEMESPYIDYLGTDPLTKTDGYIIYFGTYGQSAQGRLIEQEFVSEQSFSSRLTERIASDLSPDLCQKPENVYYLITKNLFEDLTSYIDTDAPQWQNYSEYLDTHKYKNGNYFYPTSIKQSPYFLAYRSGQATSYLNGSKSPAELWSEGRWDYNAFCNLANGSGMYVMVDSLANLDPQVYKRVPMENLLISAGKPLIDIGTDGQPFTNMASVGFFEELCSIGSMIAGSVRSVSDVGYGGFLSLNDEQLAQIRISESLGDIENIEIVPYPVSDDGKYYGVTEGYLVPKRAKNIKAAVRFINGSRIAASLEELPENLTDRDKDILTELRGQSYAKMTEGCVSFIDADTKTELNSLWKYDDFPNMEQSKFDSCEKSLTKVLSELDRNTK